jgi:glutathione synthase/RimK-type ligase-like ATP-grasp enzyme
MADSQKLTSTELLFRCAQQMGLRPSWITPHGLFAISVGEQEQYVHFARSPLNSQTSASLAKNKYMTRLILERHGMLNIPFTLTTSHEEAIRFLELHQKIIAKPVRGAGAHDIHIVTSPTELQSLNINEYILEKYISGAEIRYLILNGGVIGVHRSDYGVSVEETRPLERISYPSSDWDPALVASSIHVAAILSLQFAAIDYLIDDAGRPYILEVNTMPGLKWFHAPTSGPVVDVARQFLESMINRQEVTGIHNNRGKLEAHPITAYS